MLKNFEKHDLAARNGPNTSKNNKEKKNQSRKRQKNQEDTKAESYQMDGGQYCHLCHTFGASESRIKSHTPDKCRSAKYYQKKLAQLEQNSSNNDRKDNNKSGSKKRKTSREINAMEIDSSESETETKKRKSSQLFESFMTMMMNEFKKRKTEYSSDSS
jgi:hypothetical protein